MSKVNNHTIRDIFNFWVRNQRKERPYLKLKYPNRNKNSELWYTVKSEITYLQEKILKLDADIQKLEAYDRNITHFTSATRSIYEKRQEIYEAKEKIKELQKEPPETEKMLMDYETFREVVYCYNKKAAEEMIQNGEVVNLNERLGYVYILKVPKRTTMIDWKASNEFKQELIDQGLTPKDADNPNGENWLQMHDSDYYLRVAWQKQKGVCRVKNHTVYGFYPTATSSKGVPGVRTKLAKANQDNPLLHLKYISR